MISFDKGVAFDPGFAPYVTCFSENANAIDEVMASLKTPHQKKFRFQVFSPQIYKLFENIISFYQGCLLWASYISIKFKDNPKEVLNNFSLGKKLDDYDFLFEVDFLINYFDKYEKDSKYFLSKSAHLPPDWLKLAKVYKEFLILNENFINTKTTADIKLPAAVKYDFDLDEVLAAIDKSIADGNLSSLLEIEIFNLL